MTWSWVASAVFASGLAGGQTNVRSVSPLDRISDALLSVQLPGQQRAANHAVLIEESGLFLLATGSLRFDKLTGQSKNGQSYTLTLINRDEIVQLALYQAEKWNPKSAKAILAATSADLNTQKVFAVLPAQTLIGEVSSQSRTGIMQPSQRYVPLSEIRFEEPGVPYGGAPVFTLDGKLAGILNAALVPFQVNQSTQKIGLGSGGAGGGAGGRPGTSDPQKNPLTQNVESGFGPRGLSIGFSLAPTVLSRVVDGFCSPDHTPKHPSIGIYYTSHRQGGVELQTVDPNSPAEQAGLRPGDRITEMDGYAVKDAVQLASLMFDSAIGQIRAFKVLRAGKPMEFKVKVAELPKAQVQGAQATPKAKNPE